MMRLFKLTVLLSFLSCQTWAQTLIKDTDSNTKVETEATPNDNIVRITTAGVARMTVNANAAGFTLIDILNNNQNILLGGAAGLNLDPASTQNVIIGHHAGLLTTTGSTNVFVGALAGKVTTSGSMNIAIGASSLVNNISGSSNVAIGDKSLFYHTTGSSNTAVGRNTLFNNTIGNFNVAIGLSAGDGPAANINCTLVGTDADNAVANTNLTNSTGLGFGARISASNQVRIGNSSVTSIGGFANWTNVSDGRIKTNIRENVPGLDFILQLRPVTYRLDLDGINRRLNRDLDVEERASMAEKSRILYTGFIAQEVEEAAGQIHYDFSGVDAPKNPDDLYGLRYAEFVAPMVKAIQEQQALIDSQQAQIAELRSMVAQLLNRQNTGMPKMHIWPNPAGETVQVMATGVLPGSTLNLYSTDGKLLASQPAQEGIQTIDLKNHLGNSYILQMAIPGQLPISQVVFKGK